ncbi:MAG: hypothetical protein KGI69_02210 [Patescibacteria group bacterium]|nr:hypothetical protein [Patescibacteria group bacterium]
MTDATKPHLADLGTAQAVGTARVNYLNAVAACLASASRNGTGRASNKAVKDARACARELDIKTGDCLEASLDDDLGRLIGRDKRMWAELLCSAHEASPACYDALLALSPFCVDGQAAVIACEKGAAGGMVLRIVGGSFKESLEKALRELPKTERHFVVIKMDMPPIAFK